MGGEYRAAGRNRRVDATADGASATFYPHAPVLLAARTLHERWTDPCGGQRGNFGASEGSRQTAGEGSSDSRSGETGPAVRVPSRSKVGLEPDSDEWEGVQALSGE